MAKNLLKFLQSKQGYVVRAVIVFGLAYLAGSWAIDSGHLVVYLLTVLCIASGLKLLIRVVRSGKQR